VIRYKKPNSGFTLIEILIVLVLAVLVMAVVVPRFSSGTAAIKFRSAVKEIASGLRYIRMQAVTKNQETEFIFNLDENYYQLSGRENKYQIPNDITVTVYSAASQDSYNTQGVILFFPDGSSTGGRITLEIEEQKRLIDVNWLTGQVEISDPEAE
jgi:general secretion pathway protein H